MDSRPLIPRRPARADVEWLMDAVDEWATTSGWDLRDRWTTPAELAARLWRQAAACAVLDGGDHEPVGLVQIVDLDIVNGHATLDVMARPGREEACGPLVARLAARATALHRLRKLCLSGAVDRMPDRTAMGAPITRVGRRPGHHRRGRERYVDVVLYEMEIPPP